MSLTRELEAELLEHSRADSTPFQPKAPAANLSGALLDNLAFERLIGEGGMGQVWLARDTELDIPVAVKVLLPELAADQQLVMRFLREARAVASLDHPNIVRVLQAGRREHAGSYLRVMVMEYVEGADAHAALRETGRIDAERAARIALGAARALRYAHGKGVIHRDVKPHNMLLPGGDGSDVKLLDFGLARIAAPEAARLTMTNAVMGTPQYMSPEQAQGKHTDARSDVYSLGITLYELVSGRIPFPGESAFTILEGHVRGELAFPEDAFTGVPPVFRELIIGMCAKAPDDRVPLKLVIEKLEEFLGVSRSASSKPAESEGPRTNLERHSTSFVGRERELAELRQRLEGGARLVTVMGPGGIGKTRFTREFGLSVASEYPAGVWFCDLTEARSELGVCNGVGQGMCLPLTQADAVGQIHAAIRLRGRMLIILDNFEQVTEHATATLGVWLKDTPEVQFIASSREPLHLDGEKTYPLHPLEAEGEACPAVRLFADRAADVRSGFKLDDSNREAVRRIVTELDGIPLAIELAAARVAALSPKQILERLPKRFELLTSRRRDASARQMTLRGAIEWSWNLLQPFEQLALAQCSVFRDGFFLDAAEAVIDLSDFPDTPLTMDVIESLVEKSLLRAYETPQLPGETRYRMYESIREYSDWKMADPQALGSVGAPPAPSQGTGKAALPPTGPQAAQDLRERHGKHYVEYSEAWEERIKTHDGLEALNRLELEVENLFAVQDGLEANNPSTAARALLAADKVLKVRGPWLPRIPRLERALAALTEPDDVVRTQLFSALTWAHMDCGTREGTIHSSTQALAVAENLGADPTSLRHKAHALAGLGCVHQRHGEYDAALDCFAEAEAIYHELDNRAGFSITFSNRGNVHADRGDYEGAVACYAQAEAIDRELGDRTGIAVSVGNRGTIHAARGEYEAALACYAEAETISRELGNRALVATNVGNRGGICFHHGENAAALACFTEAEAIQRELGDRAWLAGSVSNLGAIHSRRGEYDAALACHAEAGAIYRELGDRRRLAWSATSRGAVHARRGEYDAAQACYADAEATFHELDDREGLAAMNNSRSVSHYLRGEYDAALACCVKSEVINRELGRRPAIAINLGNRGLYLHLKGLRQEALAPLEESLALYEAVNQQRSESFFGTTSTLAKVNFELAREGNEEAESAAPQANDKSAPDQAVKAIELARKAHALAADLAITAEHHDPYLRDAFNWVTEILASAPPTE